MSDEVKELEEEVEADEEDFADTFEDAEDEVAEDKPKKERKPQVVPFLTEEMLNDKVTLTEYHDFLVNVYGRIVGGKTAKDVWGKMNKTQQKAANEPFVLKREFGVGATVVPKSAAEQRAYDIKKQVIDEMYAVAATHLEEGGILEELQQLNPDKEVDIQIYFKGWNEFWKGLPSDA